jgi:hypothetical protein
MDAEAPIMPVFQYFRWVGSFLLATLLAANWCLPAPIATQGGVPLDQKIKIRIHTDHKWPERVVLDDAPRATVAHDAKADSETNVAGSETAILAERQPFEAFAEMAPPQGRVFDRRATPRVQLGSPRRLRKARRSKIARACR